MIDMHRDLWQVEGSNMLLQNLIPNPKAKTVFERIRWHGTVSKAKLAEETGMTVSTLTRVLDELNGAGLVQEVGFGQSTGGRRPILYRIHLDYAYVFGLEISRTAARLLLCDMELNRVDSRDWKMDESMTPSALIEEVSVAVRSLLEGDGRSARRILGMGIGAVGPLDRERGVIENPRYFPAPGWENVPICEELSERLGGIPVLLDNGVNNALLGEYWAGGVHDYEHQLYVHVGVGLRSAMMSGRNVVYGAVDMEGAVGQMVIQYDGLPHREPDGNYGALESYVSLYALEREARSRLKLGRQSVMREWVRDFDEIRFSHLVRAVKEEDPLAKEIFLQAAGYFGTGLANLLNILHPEKVILGGPLIASNDLFFAAATEVALKKTYYYPKYQVEFSRGRLGEVAVATGSAALLLNRLTRS